MVRKYDSHTCLSYMWMPCVATLNGGVFLVYIVKVKQLVEAFGADRLMWGSDFPFVVEQCGYTKAGARTHKLSASQSRSMCAIEMLSRQTGEIYTNLHNFKNLNLQF